MAAPLDITEVDSLAEWEKISGAEAIKDNMLRSKSRTFPFSHVQCCAAHLRGTLALPLPLIRVE